MQAAATRHISEAMTSVGARVAETLDSMAGEMDEEARTALMAALREEVRRIQFNEEYSVTVL